MKKNNFNFRYNHKIAIFSISTVFFLYLLYLSIPSLYDSGRVQKVFNDKFLTDFNLNISLSTDISYRILPQPHFLIKDAKLFYKKKNLLNEIGHIKELKIYVSKKNFFKEKNVEILKVEFNKSNFFLMKNDFIFFKKYLNKKFSEKKLIIKKSKFFLNDDNKNIIFIYTINKSKLNFNLEDDTNFLSTIGEIYKIPVELNWSKNFTTKKKITEINTKKIFIDSLNEGNFIKGKYEYENILNLFSSRLKTKYEISDEMLVFESKTSLIKSTPIKYKGIVNFKPFNFKINIDSKKLDFSYFWKNLYLVNELISTELLLNQNLYGNIFISSEKIIKNKNFNKIALNINFKESEINFDNTRLFSDKLGEIEVHDSILQSIEGFAILSAKLKLKIKEQDLFHKNFLIPKKNRKEIKNLIFDISFQLDDGLIIVNGVFFEDNNKIKNFDAIDQIVENNKQIKYDYYNSILFRKFIKEIIIAYSQVG
ncbi:MAG: hypothetical protein ACJZ4I_03655 [Candidatus Pelagibacter sp.]